MRLALLALFLALPLTAQESLLPMIEVPNTATIRGHVIPGVVMQRVVELVGHSFPREGAACLYGTIRPHPAERDTVDVLHILAAEPARIDSATMTRIRFRCYPNPALAPLVLVGVAHSHLFVACDPGKDPSHQDFLTLMRQRWPLVSMVVCFDGSYVLAFRDGRRYHHQYVERGR